MTAAVFGSFKEMGGIVAMLQGVDNSFYKTQDVEHSPSGTIASPGAGGIARQNEGINFGM